MDDTCEPSCLYICVFMYVCILSMCTSSALSAALQIVECVVYERITYHPYEQCSSPCHVHVYVRRKSSRLVAASFLVMMQWISLPERHQKGKDLYVQNELRRRKWLYVHSNICYVEVCSC